MFSIPFQYSATSSRPKLRAIYTKLRVSFSRHGPAKPIPLLRNLGPIRVSSPTIFEISVMSAPVCSHIALMLLMEDIRYASIAFETSFPNSDDQSFAVMMQLSGTHALYSSTSVASPTNPSSDRSEPISTRSGDCKSLIADPSDKNSGFERIVKRISELLDITSARKSAVCKGTVDFSTIILGDYVSP